MWSHQLHAFRTDPNYTILFIDNRGSGASSIPPASLASAPGYDILTMARDALAVIDTVWGRTTHFHLVGHSMGSMIAQRLTLFASALSTDQRVLSLTLLSGHDGGWFWNNCPTPIMFRAFFDLIRSAFDDHVFANVHLSMHYTQRFLYEKLLDRNTGHKVSRRDIYLQRYLDGIRRDKQNDSTGYSFWGHLAAVRSHHLADEDASTLRDAQFPKMVVYGGEDPVVLPRASRELAHRIGAECVEVAGSHFIIDEAAREVNSMLLLNFSKGRKSRGYDQVPVGRFRWIV